MGTFGRFLELGVLRELGDGFGEDHVRAGFDVGGGAVHGGDEAFVCERVGAGHDDEVGVGAGVDGGADAVDHLFGGHDLFPRAVAAALGADLVFHVDGGRPGLADGADGAGDVERATPAGVDVDEQGEGAGFGDATDVDEDVVHGADAEVRDAERVRGHAAAGQVQRLEAGGLRQPRGIGGDGADDL